MSDTILTRILVVEDNLIISMHLSTMLEELGARDIEAVATVAEAFEQLEAGAFTLAIVDIQVGRENGLVVADRCLTAGIPVILSTGFGDAMRPAISASEVLLNKPYSINDLERAIEKLSPASP